ncbi:ATP-dependent nuclease [Marinomonas sp. NPDC078689]|uniref:ATP-dependent nuclease n=1 Tax=Marinomonas sp. NPDC078689 TaxID=3364147 RepID=UPI0037C5F75D
MAVKLEKFVVKNFKSIGHQPVEIELDEIVILVGGNNYGKSTILKAYHAAVNSEKLTKDDFHNCIISDPESYPTVELHILCSGDDTPGEKFQEPIEDSEYVRVKEQFVWERPNVAPVRKGYRVDLGRFAVDTDAPPKCPWASDNASRKKRPKAHLIDTFDDPNAQNNVIKSLVVEVLLEDQIKSFKSEKHDFDFSSIYENLNSLKSEFIDNAREGLESIAGDISRYVKKIVPNHNLHINVVSDEVVSSNIKIFDSNDVEISFGKNDSLFPIESHGSGARRTLLWSLLKAIADLGYESKGKKIAELGSIKSHLLLLDEPELSLHPSACRQTRDMLYDLAEMHDNWQVMVTTHSPSFIDLTRDHTKIIRVEIENDNVQATTIFRPEDVAFNEDESEDLKLLNLMRPDALEFFFGGKVLLVEGDTEFSAFSKIIYDDKNEHHENSIFNELLVLRCNGKVQVSMFMKILNHFKKDYFVLHDIDTKQIIKNRKFKDENRRNIETNPAWTNNAKIADQMSVYSSVYASIINFEAAYFDECIHAGKPQNAIDKLRDEDIYRTVKELLTAIVEDGQLPVGAIKWESLDQISEAFDSYSEEHPEVIPVL